MDWLGFTETKDGVARKEIYDGFVINDLICLLLLIFIMNFVGASCFKLFADSFDGGLCFCFWIWINAC